MATKNFIKIDVTDWAIEHDQIEPNISDEDRLIGLVTQAGMSTAKAARLGIIAREKELAPEDILPANKPLLNSGAAVALSSVIARRHIEAQTPSGNTYSVREFVAPVREEGEDDQMLRETQSNSVTPPSLTDESYAPVHSEEAKGRAWDYLLKRIPGYIYGRLKIVAVNGGDVKAAADELKAKIDELVERLG